MIIAGSSKLQMQSVLYNSGGCTARKPHKNPAASWAATPEPPARALRLPLLSSAAGPGSCTHTPPR
jgi:hypothetical protein